MSEQHDEVAAQRALRELRAQWQPALDADNAALDADIAARLEHARTRALLASHRRRRRWLAVPAVAAVFVVLMLQLTQPFMQGTPPQYPAVAPTGLDLDVSELEPWQEDVELIDELDFYAWLELEAQHAS